MSLCSRAYKILCHRYRGLLSRQSVALRLADPRRRGAGGADTSAIVAGATDLEALEPRVLLSGAHFDRVDFLNDPDVNAVINIEFDDLAAGTDLTDAAIDGVTFEAPGDGPLTVIEAAAGVRNAMAATSGTQILSPGGSDVTIEDDDLRIVFDQPVQAAGLDVIFDVPDGQSFTGVTFLDENDQTLFTDGFIPSPNGAPGSQFVGYAAQDRVIRSNSTRRKSPPIVSSVTRTVCSRPKISTTTRRTPAKSARVTRSRRSTR